MTCTRTSSAAALLLLFSLASPPAFAEWTALAQEQGVEVEQQEVPGRGLPMFRGTGQVAADVDTIIDTIRDVSQHTQWMPDCSESRVVEEDGDTTYVYRVTAAPWPVSDRDVVLRTRIVVVEPGVEVHVYFDAVDEPVVPEASGSVRMPYLKGFYKVKALGPNLSQVEYQVDADPGGSLPGWLAARTTRGNPIRTFTGLRAQVAAKAPSSVSAAPKKR